MQTVFNGKKEFLWNLSFLTEYLSFIKISETKI